MEEIFVKEITFKFVVIFGIIFLLFMIPIRNYWRKLALNRAKQSLKENERIIYVAKFHFIVDFVAPFVVGGVVGGYILPFFLYPDLQHVDQITRESLVIFIPLAFICLLTTLFISCVVDVITNFKCQRYLAFSFLDSLSKHDFNKKISEFKSIELKQLCLIKFLKIQLKNNFTYDLCGFGKLHEIKRIIEEMIEEKEYINE